MTVIGTAEEINNVIHGISPGFPRQNLESIKSNHCCYVMNQTLVEIILHEERPVRERRHGGESE